MNNEPVAWMELYYGEPNNLAWTDAELRDSGGIYKTVPLYTYEQITPSGFLNASEPVYPAKTLTDEEIWKLWQQHLDDEIIVFARAILKKANEK